MLCLREAVRENGGGMIINWVTPHCAKLCLEFSGPPAGHQHSFERHLPPNIISTTTSKNRNREGLPPPPPSGPLHAPLLGPAFSFYETPSLPLQVYLSFPSQVPSFTGLSLTHISVSSALELGTLAQMGDFSIQEVETEDQQFRSSSGAWPMWAT